MRNLPMPSARPHKRLVQGLAPLTVLMALAGTSAALAHENYALIVTASDYPNLDPRNWLKGPKNDAVLVRDYLLHAAPVPFKPENVTTLGSGESMELATHQRILDDMKRLAEEAKPGDFVFLQFSGHGSQQPALNDTTEADGRDEVFLSADTQNAPADNPTYMPNVLTDDEIATGLTAIRKAGAFVWVVFDACHSGTMTRGAPDATGTMMREIKPEDLGIPDSAFRKPAAAMGAEALRSGPLPSSVYDDSGDASEGGMVAFFAANTTEQAPETPYDVTGPDGTTTQVTYGVFTHAIVGALAKNPHLTYRQLAQSVLADYVAENWVKPTPLFQGKLDAPVFGSSDAGAAQQWSVVLSTDATKLSINAGTLNGLSVGSKLWLLPDPAASTDQAIGAMQVASASELRSTIVPVADGGHPALTLDQVPAGAYVRPAEVQYPFELTVARPDPASADAAQIKAVDDALAAIDAQASKPLRLKLVDAGEPADLRLAVMSDAKVASLGDPGIAGGALDDAPKLWLLPASGEISLSPDKRPPAMALAGGVPAGASFTKKLEDTLVTVFRATGLSRLTAANSYGAKDFTLAFGQQAAGSDQIAPIAPEDTPIIRPNDRLYADFTNASGKPADLNLLFVDHDYGITLLCAAHLAPGDRLFQPIADIQDNDRGSERLIAIINESGKDLTDLHFLTQPGLAGLREIEQPGLLGMLSDLGNGEVTRAAPPAARDPKVPRGAVVMMPLEALPATGQPAAAGIAPADPRAPVGECTL